MKISIIIPTMNEEENLTRLLPELQKNFDNPEIIISDANSSDKTKEIAASFGVLYCSSRRSRGLQASCGAEMASGDILLFLHADSIIPANASPLIYDYFAESGNKIACFKLGFDSDNLLLKFYCWFTRFDSVFTTFGDQAIIIRKEFYESLGGFPNYKIFEDVHLLSAARRRTKIGKLNAKIITSPRRFARLGMVKTQLLNFYYIFLYFIGIDTDTIYDKYFG